MEYNTYLSHLHTLFDTILIIMLAIKENAHLHSMFITISSGFPEQCLFCKKGLNPVLQGRKTIPLRNEHQW